MYKALRVLEKNKDKESTCYSKSVEKLIRYFSKKFPEDFGIEKSLNDFALQNFQEDPSSDFKQLTASMYSEFSGDLEELNRQMAQTIGQKSNSSRTPEREVPTTDKKLEEPEAAAIA